MPFQMLWLILILDCGRIAGPQLRLKLLLLLLMMNADFSNILLSATMYIDSSFILSDLLIIFQPKNMICCVLLK